MNLRVRVWVPGRLMFGFRGHFQVVLQSVLNHSILPPVCVRVLGVTEPRELIWGHTLDQVEVERQ